MREEDEPEPGLDYALPEEPEEPPRLRRNAEAPAVRT